MKRSRYSLSTDTLTARAAALLDVTNRNGGVTATLRTLFPINLTGGCIVSIASETRNAVQWNAADIIAVAASYAAHVDRIGKGSVFASYVFGLYRFEDGIRVSADLNILAASRPIAIAIGRALDQESIYDATAGECINVGGSGRTPSLESSLAIARRVAIEVG